MAYKLSQLFNRYPLASAAGILIFTTVLVSALIMLLSSIKNPYGEELQISNLSQYTAVDDLNSDTLDQIQHNLFEMVYRNGYRSVKSNYIKDIFVREGSFKQTYDEKTKKNYVEFIVDSASIERSYLVNYQWIRDDTEGNIDQYGNIVSCLPPDELKYSDFLCKDLFTDMRGSISPYIDFDWSARDNYNNPVDMQVEPQELQYIEEQIFGDYRIHNKLSRMTTSSRIESATRETDVSNTLYISIRVANKARYEIIIDFGLNKDDERSVSVKNLDTGAVYISSS